jgi:hypothetical protein
MEQQRRLHITSEHWIWRNSEWTLGADTQRTIPWLLLTSQLLSFSRKWEFNRETSRTMNSVIRRSLEVCRNSYWCTYLNCGTGFVLSADWSEAFALPFGGNNSTERHNCNTATKHTLSETRHISSLHSRQQLILSATWSSVTGRPPPNKAVWRTVPVDAGTPRSVST